MEAVAGDAPDLVERRGSVETKPDPVLPKREHAVSSTAAEKIWHSGQPCGP